MTTEIGPGCRPARPSGRGRRRRSGLRAAGPGRRHGAAARQARAAGGEADRLFPGGPVEVLAYLRERADRRTVEDMEKEGVGELKIRDRISAGGALRLEQHGRRQGGGPPRRWRCWRCRSMRPLALKLLYRTVDAMWYAAGDTSTDFNFYTKRATLAGVYSARPCSTG